MNQIYVPNIVEANGRTIRQNNMEIEHKIPLGALVEINIPYNENHGMRMRVVQHDRDCDGSPLYSLSFMSLESINEWKDLNIKPEVLKFAFNGGYSDSSLIVILENGYDENSYDWS